MGTTARPSTLQLVAALGAPGPVSRSTKDTISPGGRVAFWGGVEDHNKECPTRGAHIRQLLRLPEISRADLKGTPLECVYGWGGGQIWVITFNS